MRFSPVLVLALTLAPIGLAGCEGDDGEETTSSTVTSVSEWRPEAGADLTEPVQLQSEDGVLEVELTAEREVIEVSGSPITAQPFNGHLIGPTLRVSPGDRIEVELDNRTKEMTNIHYHGMHVSPKGISDNVFRSFPPGEVSKSAIELPPDHEPGTFWYHVHHHGNTDSQAMGGLSGLLIVEGLEERLPDELQEIEQRQLAIRDVEHKGDSVILNAADIDPSKPTTRLINGLLRPHMEIESGETQMWRIANVGADLFYDVQLEGHQLAVLAEDGSPVWEVWEADHLVLPPGKRYDVLVQGGEPGNYAFRTLRYDEGFQLLPKIELAEVEVTGEAAEPAAALPASMESSDEDLSDAPIAGKRKFTFSLDFPKDEFLAKINGEVFDPDKVNVSPRLGTVEEWTLRNVSSEDHPFHIHVNDFQVMSVDGKPYDAHGLQDVVVVPKKGGEVVIRNPFEDFTGEFVFHCHILGHEDAGMMQTVDVVDASGAGGSQPDHEH